MPIYARIDSGIVAELYTPPVEVAATPIAELFHADLRWVDVSAVSPQPEARWTYDGAVFAPPAPPPPPTLQQQAMALLGQPVTVNCLALPALDGAYPIDQATQMQITGIGATAAQLSWNAFTRCMRISASRSRLLMMVLPTAVSFVGWKCPSMTPGAPAVFVGVRWIRVSLEFDASFRPASYIA
jgi:hypothetical protein